VTFQFDEWRRRNESRRYGIDEMTDFYIFSLANGCAFRYDTRDSLVVICGGNRGTDDQRRNESPLGFCLRALILWFFRRFLHRYFEILKCPTASRMRLRTSLAPGALIFCFPKISADGRVPARMLHRNKMACIGLQPQY